MPALEMRALTLAAATFGHRWRGMRVTVRCDCQPAVCPVLPQAHRNGRQHSGTPVSALGRAARPRLLLYRRGEHGRTRRRSHAHCLRIAASSASLPRLLVSRACRSTQIFLSMNAKKRGRNPHPSAKAKAAAKALREAEALAAQAKEAAEKKAEELARDGDDYDGADAYDDDAKEAAARGAVAKEKGETGGSTAAAAVGGGGARRRTRRRVRREEGGEGSARGRRVRPTPTRRTRMMPSP